MVRFGGANRISGFIEIYQFVRMGVLYYMESRLIGKIGDKSPNRKYLSFNFRLIGNVKLFNFRLIENIKLFNFRLIGNIKCFNFGLIGNNKLFNVGLIGNIKCFNFRLIGNMSNRKPQNFQFLIGNMSNRKHQNFSISV